MSEETSTLLTVPPSPSRIKAPDENTYAELTEFKTATGFSLSELGKKLSMDGSQVSKYLSRKFEGDIEKFEAVARDVMKAHHARADVRSLRLFRCKQSDAVKVYCEQIRKTCDVGLIYGPAGVGKTCGASLYALENPSAIYITINRWSSDYTGIEQAILQQIDLRAFKKSKMRAGDYLVDRFKKAQRLIVVDNAHRLPVDSLRWVFDFNDATDCPIALVGNPEVLEKVQTSDQLRSRIGLRKEVVMADPAHIAQELLKQFAPEHVGDLLAHAIEVVSKPDGGHGRTLRKQLMFFREIVNTDAMRKQPAEDVFRASGLQLVNGSAK